MDEGASRVSRRTILAGAGSLGASTLAGCSEQFWSRAEDTGPEQVELTIKTLPADDDAVAAKLMSQLRENYIAAGIDATHEPLGRADLYRDIFLEGDYDVFVIRHPGLKEFDALRGLLHSSFTTERGWQNPFRFSDVTIDDLLESQQSSNADRDESLAELFEFLEETAPYTTIAYPHQVGGVRPDLDVSISPRHPLEYVDVLATERADGPRDGPIAIGVYGEGLTNRFNPIVVDQNSIPGLLGLVYDPLARRVPSEDDVVPWLAESVSWDETDDTRATVTLHEGTRWHDGAELDADDVVFTMEFLEDTSLGAIDGSVPAPRYRARLALLEGVTRIDERTVELSFGSTRRSAAARVLTIPLLPEHIWEPRSEVVAEHRTEAVLADNEEPIGAGLFRFESVTADSLELAPFDDHVLRDPVAQPEILDGESAFTGIHFRIDPNVGAMIDALLDGEIDLTASNIPPSELDTFREASGATIVSTQSRAFYMIGYNYHHSSLVNPHFRRILSRLIDREHVVSELFDGLAEPAMSRNSLVGITDDAWDDNRASSVTTFPGTDGEIATQEVRSLFEDAGYQYENDALIE
ncbi:ABC transporter substrate-binding protein [Salinadaptatus halalkaliphilus]|uniref:ABC transporter substrate-binding protein n=1 Tax=Salinadaptatus halalkaliphilus TaxID=2419781 RepID=A0A4S3TNI9_9EURY|nr:ABC transporter substrate-binding protein [Salinadaptatus halalkaliphilus]THE64793.1 ABC transporter substrate-binding protein [Salinadaptatus halalkaliphilus]